MYPDELFLHVHLYGIMIAIGILCAFATLYLFSAKKRVEGRFVDFIFYNGVVSIAIGFLFARLFQAFYDYLDNPDFSYWYYVKNGGITFLGGLIGGAMCFLTIYFIMRKKYSAKLTDELSIIPCCILVGHAFGRIGCFFAGCCYGKETSSWIGVKFKYLDVKVYPTQLFEAIFLFVLFAVCSFLLIKFNFKHNLSLYFIAYGTFRFFIEFLRDDYRGKLIGNLSPSQFWSILMVCIGVALIFVVNYLNKAKTAPPTEAEKTV